MSSSIVIRRACRGDAAALLRLAALDDTRPLRGEILLAELGGDPLAALSLSDGRTIADPFRRTAELVDLLRVRAEQVRAPAPAQSHAAALQPVVAG